MQKIPVTNEISHNEDEPETIVYSKKYNGWVVRASTKPIDFAILTQDEWYKYKAGNIKFIFSQYDSEKHTIVESTHSPEINLYNGHYLELREYVVNKIEIPYGCFCFKNDPYGGTFLKKIEIKSDGYIDIGESPIDLYKDYLEFRIEKEKYKKLKKYNNRRPRKGVLLFGAPGNSKTMQISKLAQHAELDKFRVFFVPNNVGFDHIDEFRSVLEEEDNVFILEEITERAHKAEELLSFLDGEMSWGNCYTVATTNYPEDLAWNIVDRPRRFKIIKEFLPPNANQRRKYLEKMDFPEKDIEEAVKLTEGMSLDYLINIAFDAMLSDKPIQKVVNEYREERKKLSKTFKGKIGLG